MIVRNLWREIVPVCGKCGEPFQTPDSGQNLVYFCPNKYKGTCNNSFTADEYFKVMEKLSSDFAAAEMEEKSQTNFTGHSFKVRHLDCTVTKHEGDKLVLSIINKKKG